MDLEMSKDERKRLERLQEDGSKGVGAYGLKDLTYPDLQLLLVADPTIQDLIRQIVAPMFDALTNAETEAAVAGEADTSTKPKKIRSKSSPALIPEPVSQITVQPEPPIIEYVEVIKKVPVEVRVEVPVHDPLRAELAPELELLKAVKADAELAQAWLWADESEGRQLVRLLTMLSEWDEVLSLWSRLASRCKDGQRAATPVERAILEAALALHNLRYRDRAAQLKTAEIGASFHHESMERGTIKGSTVAEVWWPGITNAAGQLQKKPVVKTT
jgi:hypothetical protein